MKTTITLIAASFLLALTSLSAQETPTYKERLLQVLKGEVATDSATAIALRAEIITKGPTVESKRAAFTLEFIDTGTNFPLAGETLNADVEAFWRAVAAVNPYIATHVAIWIDQDLTLLPDSYPAILVFRHRPAHFTTAQLAPYVVAKGLAKPHYKK
jgi:hypothetical protein